MIFNPIGYLFIGIKDTEFSVIGMCILVICESTCVNNNNKYDMKYNKVPLFHCAMYLIIMTYDEPPYRLKDGPYFIFCSISSFKKLRHRILKRRSCNWAPVSLNILLADFHLYSKYITFLAMRVTEEMIRIMFTY